MPKLDSNAAWKEASALIAANRELLLVLAGVFFLFPSLASAVIVGEPEFAPDMGREQMMAALAAFYADAWWMIVLTSVLQVVGVLAILTLMRDRRRPTVADAIRAGLAGLLPYLAAYMLVGLGLVLIGGTLVGVAAAVLPALGVALTLFLFGFVAYAAMRLVLVGPVIAVEGARNPVAALRRSWALTRGNVWRILAFLLLVFVLFFVIIAVIMLVVGLVLAIFTSGETQRVLAAAASSAVTAVAVLYVVAILAAIHRQLAGVPAERPLDTPA